jgi:sulfur carrier protein
MFVVLNGSEHQIPEAKTLGDLLAWFLPATPFAVARNEEFVPASSYHECPVYPGDRIEIVRPMAGG